MASNFDKISNIPIFYVAIWKIYHFPFHLCTLQKLMITDEYFWKRFFFFWLGFGAFSHNFCINIRTLFPGLVSHKNSIIA